MKAKDWKIFLSVPEIHEKLYDKGFTEEECKAIICICKRAGIREVVEWINFNKTFALFPAPREFVISREEWATQLKEWGIE